jgi:hypothetical protein
VGGSVKSGNGISWGGMNGMRTRTSMSSGKLLGICSGFYPWVSVGVR